MFYIFPLIACLAEVGHSAKVESAKTSLVVDSNGHVHQEDVPDVWSKKEPVESNDATTSALVAGGKGGTGEPAPWEPRSPLVRHEKRVEGKPHATAAMMMELSDDGVASPQRSSEGSLLADAAGCD